MIDMLNELLFTKIEEEDIGNIWCQQEGATCHTAKLHSMFCALHRADVGDAN